MQKPSCVCRHFIDIHCNPIRCLVSVVFSSFKCESNNKGPVAEKDSSVSDFACLHHAYPPPHPRPRCRCTSPLPGCFSHEVALASCLRAPLPHSSSSVDVPGPDVFPLSALQILHRRGALTFFGGVNEDHIIETPDDNIVSSSLCSRSNHSMTSFNEGLP